MIKIFTENDLIRYIYGETSEVENKEIEANVIIDPDLGEELNELRTIANGLESINMIPSDNVISKILNYSISTA